MKNNLLNKKKKGFTLIELIVVIAIIGVLAAVAVPKFINQSDTAREKADELTAKNIAMAVQTELAQGKAAESVNTIDEIKGYFNGENPVPQSQTGTFVINIDSDKNVTVSIDPSGTTTGDEIEVYPESKLGD